MDRFVTRAPTWKKMDYSTVSSSGYGRVHVAKKVTTTNITKLDKHTTKKPPAALKEKPIDKNQEITATGGRLSIRDEQLLKIFASQPDQPLLEPLASDSGCSSSSDGFPCSFGLGEQKQYDVDENTPPYRIVKNNLNFNETSTDGDKLDKLANLQVSEVLLINDIEDYPSTPPQRAFLATDLPLPSTPKDNPLIMRIQRDLNSPSASARMRALKALKSPTKSAYTQFDIPHDEQSIITAEERQATPRLLPSMQELMRNVIVYVEVRTGEDNRSAGVKKVISALGAKVNDKLLRETTHVVFKDGLLSTYKKAKAWNIPVVSILWIEACKNQRKICDPFEFPISNIDRYENPELYEKMKRHKSMQPDSEVNKRVRVKPGTTKDSTNTVTPKSGALKKTSTLIGGTPTSTGNKKTDISRFFKQLGSHKKSSAATHADTPNTPTTNNVDFPTESPATQFLNKINADYYTHNDEGSIFCIPDVQHVKKAINLVSETIVDDTTPTKKTIRRTQTRRTTMMQMAATIEATTNSIEEMSLSQTPSKTKNVTNRNEKTMILQTPTACQTYNDEMSVAETPKRKSAVKPTKTPSRSSVRRRNSTNNCATTADANVSQDVQGYKKTTNIHHNINTITEEEPTMNVNKSNLAPPTTPKTKKSSHSRRTICTGKSQQFTQMTKDATKAECDDKVKETKEQEVKLTKAPESADVEVEQNKIADLKQMKSTRRTLFTPQKLLESCSLDYLETKANQSGSVRTPSAPKSLPRASKSLANAVKRLPLDTKCSNVYVGDMETSNVADFKEEPTPTPVASSTRIIQNNDDTVKGPKLIGSLLEEHANATVFSSTRNPGRRRTLFDVSMDIISQRLQNINQSSAARRSMARPSNYDLEVRRNSLEQETPQLQSPVYSSMPNIPIANTCKQLFATPTANVVKTPVEGTTAVSDDNNEKSATDVRANDEDAQTPVIKKKRKLYVPNETPLLQTAIPTQSASRNSINMTPKSNVKRRRTLMPLSQPQTDVKSIISTVQPSKSAILIAENPKQIENSTDVATVKNTNASRRSTLDFEAATKLKICATTGAKKIVVSGNNKAPVPSQNILDVAKNNAKSQNAAAVQSAVIKNWPNTPAAYLVYTNMHKEQIEVIKQAVEKLGFFTLEDNVSDVTTHVVSMEPRRTLNLLRALSRGLWILEFPWIEDSLRAGVWLSEEQYEMKDFSRAVEICRVERQAFGKDYRSELFTGLGLFYLPTRCGPLQKQDLSELIQLCGGKITDQRKRAKYILGDANRMLEDKAYVTPFWILDSITQMQLQKLCKYVPVTNNGCTVFVAQPPNPSQSNSPRTQCVFHDAKLNIV